MKGEITLFQAMKNTLINHHKLQAKKTAHFYTRGELSENTRQFWFCCHGYGHTASDFLKQFEGLETEGNFLVAPEGFSRFYFGGFDGKIGASWMTSLNREIEIEDYCDYLDQLFSSFKDKIPKKATINLLGFSQGANTISRWAGLRKPIFDRMILVGGHLAEDVDYSANKEYWSEKEVWFCFGDADKFITEERLHKFKNFNEANHINPHYLTYQGKHKVVKDLFTRLPFISKQ